MLEKQENSAVAQHWKSFVFIPVPKKDNAKKCSHYHTIALISHTSRVMLKILQAWLQHYMNLELLDIQADLEKTEEPQIKLPTSTGSLKKQERVPEKHLLLPFWLYQNLWLYGIQQTGKFFKRWQCQTTWPVSWEICMQLRKQHWELGMEQQTGSKSGKE